MAVRFLVGSGAFTSTSIWSDTYGGASGAPAPVSGDTIYVDNNYNITSGLPTTGSFDFIVRLGANTASGVTLGLSGSPTFRLLDIRSANSAAHTVNFEADYTTGNGAISLSKLIAIGSSSSARLKLRCMNTSGEIWLSPQTGFTCYGQYVDGGSMAWNGVDSKFYIGSNSINSGDQYTNWITQDPPKISTLVDPLMTAPGSNTNWTAATYSGASLPSAATTGVQGGGYSFANKQGIISTNTYDIVDSELIIELPELTTGSDYNAFAIAVGQDTDGSIVDGFDSPPGVYVGFMFWIDRYNNDALLVARTIGGGQVGFGNPFGLGALPITSVRFLKLLVDSSSKKLKYATSSNGTTYTSYTTLPSSTADYDLVLLRSSRIYVSSQYSGSLSKPTVLGSINPNLNAAPTTALSTPANNTTLTTTTPALTFSATDPEGEAVTYEVQVSTSSSFTSTQIDALSTSDAGFSGTNPYTSGASVTYTVQSALTTGGIDYYWRVRAKDPSGSNSWGAWSTANKMTTQAIAPTVTSGSSSSITTSSATAGGNVTSDGGATITQRGIVYGTSSNPTTAGSKVTATGTTGSFTSNITGLSSNTAYHFRAYAINSKGTSYGSDQTFSTPPKPPVIATGTVSGTTTSSFTVTGSGVTSNPDTQTIDEFGVVYDTSTNPTIANSSQVGTGTSSSYNDILSSLTENTTYYVRAYAKWGGTNYAYGSQITYKTQGRPVTTLDSPTNSGSSDVTKPNLKFTGSDPDNDSITYELQLNSTNSFTTPLIDALSATDTGFSNLSTSKTDPFYSGNQIQYSIATDLTRGQTYYWRTRGKDVTGTNTWGNWSTTSSFSINAILANLSTNGSHDITFNSAKIDATINSDGGAAITEEGIVWSTSTNPTVADSKVTATGTTYTATMTGLTASTTYYVRSYAINSVGTAYGNSITVQTAQTPSAPTVVTGAAASTTDITSQFNGNQVTFDGTFTVTERGIVFSDTVTTPTLNDRVIVAPAAGLGSYNATMTGLDPSTTYYVRAYAVNSYGTGYGSVVSFTTQPPFTPDEGDGYWSFAPGQSQATVGRSQATQAYSSADLPLEDLSLTSGLEYTLYYSGADSDNGTPSLTLQRYNGTTKIEDTITPGTPFTFTYDDTLIHWNIRLFVTGATDVASTITAVFNDLYLAQESTFSGFVPFVRRGITEVKVINNQIVDARREDVISSMFDQINGVSWYPFNINTEGLGYFEIGDRLTITDSAGDSKSVVVWNNKLTIDGGIKENLYANQVDLTTTDYSKAGNSKLGGNIKNTQLQVDKQKQTIDALVADMYNYDGVVNNKFSQVEQDLTSVTTTIQGAGGVNLLKNSVMYAFADDGTPDSWTMTGAGTLVIQASPESLTAGAVSGNQFTLSNKTTTQTVTVRKDVDFIAEADKTYYSISARVKKNIVGDASITLTNRNETLTIDLPDQTSYFWDMVTIEGILPKDDHYDIAITSDVDADLQVTDLILAPGKTRHEWTQANGEVMNSSVAITQDGMTIRSSAFTNNYTKIDALGFEVHKKDTGGDRVFGFNDDETNVAKLKADQQVSMAPMRIVPVSYGSYSGWAFTPSKETP